MQDKVNVLSLCSGVEGIELGLRLALPAARVVCVVEHEAFPCEIMASRMEDEALDDAPIWTDLRTFDGRPWRGVVDLVVAGYPCQPFSVAGKRRGEDDPRHLWPHVARIIRETDAPLVFCENVSGHLNLGFDEVCRCLGGMGFRVAAGLFTAEEIGASHKRERLFFLAHRTERESGELEAGIGGSRAERGGVILADPQDPGRREHVEGARPQGGAAAGRAGKGMADAGQPGREGRELRDSLHGDGDGQEAHGSAPQFPCPFPPGPGDRDAWAAILARDPGLAPATAYGVTTRGRDALRHSEEAQPSLRGVAHGMASRVDRLRACGNGVVPVVAARAFVALARELFDL